MTEKVLVTGMGIISSIGNGVDETLQSLIHLKSGLGPLELIETRYKNSFPFGEIKSSDKALKQKLKCEMDVGDTCSPDGLKGKCTKFQSKGRLPPVKWFHGRLTNSPKKETCCDQTKEVGKSIYNSPYL